MNKELMDKYRIESEEIYGKYYIDPNWLLKQISRPDGKERIIAFYESVHEAISTDDEYWLNKGCDFVNALLSNDATQLLIGLCGWGPETLARRVFMLRGRPQYQDEELPATLLVEWSDGKITETQCIIQHEDHMVCGFDYNVFSRTDEATVKINNTVVRFDPLETGNEYVFRCISQAERDEMNDDEIFWYLSEDQ